MGNSYTREDSVDGKDTTTNTRPSRGSTFLRKCSRSFKGSSVRSEEETTSEETKSEGGGEGDRNDQEGGEKKKEKKRQKSKEVDDDGENEEENETGKAAENGKKVAGEDNDDDKEQQENGKKELVEEGLEEVARPPELTEEQKEIVKSTWKVIEASVARVGVVLFMGLFETHPDVQQVFEPFRGLQMEQVKHSKELRSHALRVMGFVEKAVRRLDQPDKLERLIRECGRNHCYYGAQPHQVQLVVPQFLQAVQPALGDEWTGDVEGAWSTLLHNVTYIMREAMLEEKK